MFLSVSDRSDVSSGWGRRRWTPISPALPWMQLAPDSLAEVLPPQLFSEALENLLFAEGSREAGEDVGCSLCSLQSIPRHGAGRAQEAPSPGEGAWSAWKTAWGRQEKQKRLYQMFLTERTKIAND